MDQSTPLTFAYKHADGVDILLDLYLPQPHPGANVSADLTEGTPLVVYFHGGGLTVGNRKSWFPTWLKDRVVAAGFAFCSPDYRLLVPSNAHDILQDIKDLFSFLEDDLNRLIRLHSSSTPSASSFQIDPHAIAVAGSSAGGLCCYFSAIHANPRPIAMVGLYAMGGDYLNPNYFMPKSQVFFRGRELLDPQDFFELQYPLCKALNPISDSPLSYHPQTYHIPGYPANPRMLLTRLFLQTGTILDYYIGQHEPSFSQSLRDTFDETATPLEQEGKLKQVIPKEHLSLFPQFNVKSDWPPTFLIHGSLDSAVLVRESYRMESLLKEKGVEVKLKIMDGLEHSFDYAPDANETFGVEGGLFDEVVEFLKLHLHSPPAR